MQRKAYGDYSHLAKPLDQVSSEECRREHANAMRGDDEGTFVETQAALEHHGDWGRGHQQIHGSLADQCCHRGDDEDWLAHDLGQRSPGLGRLARRKLRDVEKHEYRGAQQRARDKEDIGAEELIGSDQILAYLCEPSAEQGRDDAARQHQRDGSASEFLGRGIGGGETIVLGKTSERTEHERSETQEPKVTEDHSGHADQTATSPYQCAENESRLASDASHIDGCRKRGNCRADDDQSRRQRRQSFVGGEGVPNHRRSHDYQCPARTKKHLADSEEKDVAFLAPVIGHARPSREFIEP